MCVDRRRRGDSYENALSSRPRARYLSGVRLAAGGLGRSRHGRRPSFDPVPSGRKRSVLLPWPQLLLVRRRLAGPGLVLVRLCLEHRLRLGRPRRLERLEPRRTGAANERPSARRAAMSTLRATPQIPCLATRQQQVIHAAHDIHDGKPPMAAPHMAASPVMPAAPVTTASRRNDERPNRSFRP